MNRNIDIWPPFLQHKLGSLRSLPIVKQCAHDWRNRSALNICEIGLSDFFMFKFLAPELHRNINWTLYHRSDSDLKSEVEGLIKWTSDYGMPIQHNSNHKSYTFHNKENHWHIELKPFDELQHVQSQNLQKHNLFALSVGLCDLPLTIVSGLFLKCYHSDMAVFLGPLYDGTFHWIPEADGDGIMIDHFHNSMLSGNGEEESGGVRAARSASAMLSQQGFAVRESEHIVRACHQKNSFLRSMVQTMKAAISSEDERAVRWSSTKFYMLAANKLKAHIGFRFAYAKPVK